MEVDYDRNPKLSGKECREVSRADKIIQKITVDSEIIKDSKLSDVLTQIRALLNSYQNELSFKVEEKGGKISGVEITAKIKI